MGAKRLSVSERGDSRAEIAQRLGRHRSTVGRELQRNTSPSPRAYRAFPAHIQASARARRPKPHKLNTLARKTLGYRTPAEALNEHLVATTI